MGVARAGDVVVRQPFYGWRIVVYSSVVYASVVDLTDRARGYACTAGGDQRWAMAASGASASRWSASVVSKASAVASCSRRASQRRWMVSR